MSYGTLHIRNLSLKFEKCLQEIIFGCTSGRGQARLRGEETVLPSPPPLASHKKSSVKMPNGAKNWCFTLNNPTDDEKRGLSELFGNEASGIRYLVFQQEVGEEGQTPHIQGYISFEGRKGLAGVKKLVGDRAHVEVARGSPKQNRDYCTKPETRVEGSMEEYGELPSSSGKRNDLEDFKEAVKEGLTKRQALEEFSEVVAKYPRFVSNYIDSQPRKLQIQDHELKPWQADLEEKLSHPPDDRSIMFVVNPSGNQGKTWFTKWYLNKNPSTTQILTPGRKPDMAHAIADDIRVLFVNISRSYDAETVKYLYSFLEDVKDGCVFSPKYESGMKYLSPVHVVVMMNHEPTMCLTSDRYHIIRI